MNAVTVRHDREAALDAGFIAMRDRAPNMTRETFAHALQGWNLEALCTGGEVVGMYMARGSEIHIAIIPRYRRRWCSRRVVRELLDSVVERYGIATTSVMNDHVAGLDFVRRLGFVPTRSDAVMTWFERTR